MIIAEGIYKSFDDIHALEDVHAEIKKGSVFGLVGTNGAGKSTFLRVMAGILKPDHGKITIEGEDVFENTAIKERFFYISDEQYFFPNATPEEMAQYYNKIYRKFSFEQFHHLMANFSLPEKRKINTFSKGMKKQLSVILAMSAQTDYIFCDETFDGLDPVMRQGVKALFAAEVAERELTPIIASHNLRELEDICDHVGLLHKGGMLLARDLDDMKLNIHKVQCIFKDTKAKTKEDWPGLEIINMEQRGSLYTMIARGEEHEILKAIQLLGASFYEILPLTLEEIFISETEVQGYDIKKLLV